MQRTDSRLDPTPTVVRALHTLSGNRCAFPDCHNPILDENGGLLAEVCHIEAAKPGGPRYNPSQSDEERRHISNLILLCRHHHRVTDNVGRYSVEVLRDMKYAHENKFSAGAGRHSYAPRLTVPSLARVVELPRNFGKIDLSDDEDIGAYRASISPLFESLSRLPRQTLEVYAIAMRFSHRHERQLALYFDPEELRLRLSFLSEVEFDSHLSVMVQYEVASPPERESGYYGGIPNQVRVYFKSQDFTDNTIWFMVEALRILVPMNELENAYMNLDFRLLDT